MDTIKIDFSLPQISLADNLPIWTTLEIKKIALPGHNRQCFIMGDHLVIVYFVWNYSSNCKSHVLSFSLLDQSLQEAEFDSLDRDNYSFVKYDEKTIIFYQAGSRRLNQLTVESFKPFKVKLEEIETQDQSAAFQKMPLTQIYQDTLYLFGRTSNTENQLWSFDLKSREWKSCTATGKLPGGEPLKSFIHQDNFYVYEKTRYTKNNNNLFMLNLSNMKWTQIKQPEEYLHSDCYRRTGAIYKNHLVFLRDDFSPRKNALCFLNLPPTNKSEWMSFPLEGCLLKSLFENLNLMIYKNLILTLAYKEETLVLAAMSLDSFGICAPQWEGEEKAISSLFLKKKESDITFKVEDQLIPAHKRVLEKRSQYFAEKDFKGVVKIQDCESEVFKEYLRFIYQETVQVSEVDGIIKLYSVAIKYLQDDLQEKCLNILIRMINDENVYKILDFSREKNICKLAPWCLKFLENNLGVSNVTGLIEYVYRQEDSEFKQNLRNVALKLILDSCVEIYGGEGEKNNRVYTDFLIKNIEMSTLPVFVKAITNYLHIQRKRRNLSNLNNGVLIEQTFESEDLLRNISQIKEATSKFINENVNTLLTSEISKDLTDFIFASLFMNQSGSDITLKVEGQIVPAHKQILIKKSRYFEKVFSSGMAESTQDAIVIQEDCGFDIFREYLRYLYQGEIHLNDNNQIFKLHALADKYRQEDLYKECANFLSKNIKEDNVYTILDFAHENNFVNLKNCCNNFLKKDFDFEKASQLITYLNHQEDLEFKENNQELIMFVMKFVTENFFNSKSQIYENFLIKNIGTDTICLLINFLRPLYQLCDYERYSDDTLIWFGNRRMAYGRAKESFNRITPLKKAVFSFLKENPKIIKTKEISGSYLSDFLGDFSLYLIEKMKQIPGQTMQAEMSQDEEKKGNGKKRMEPSQDGTGEENHVLKKTKQ